jgi:hypothetical protein
MEPKRFITAFTSARHPSLSLDSSIKSILPHPTSWRSALILSYHLNLGLPSGLSLRFSHQNPVHASSLPHMRYMPRQSHSSRFYHPLNSEWGVQIIKLLIMFSPLPIQCLQRDKLNRSLKLLKQCLQRCYNIYVIKTSKMHTSLYTSFHLNYP